MNRIVAIALAACAVAASFRGSAAGADAALILERESLRYEVRWGFIHLGDLSITQEISDSAGRGLAIVSMSGASAPHLPFIHCEFRNRSDLIRDYPTNRRFVYESGGPDGVRAVYTTDYRADELTVAVTEAGRASRVERVAHHGPLYDAGGMILLIRRLAPPIGTFEVPTIVDSAVRRTRLEFTGERRVIDSDAYAYPVAARRCRGMADWELKTGAGMTGAFEIWLSDDADAVPLRASIRIAIGSITLDLKSREISHPGDSLLTGRMGRSGGGDSR